ncbi:protocadherin-12 [Struthio camelus]|uniref:protocadherin-12 n=1 Tax=Struthio camelus TaxID=8801 RepID=UPI00051E4916|nr:PREDICTED: protocadherin-12 [Struthio camelus australis]
MPRICTYCKLCLGMQRYIDKSADLGQSGSAVGFLRSMLLLCRFTLQIPALWWYLFLSVDAQEVATFTVQYKVFEEVPNGTVIGKLSEHFGWGEGSKTAETFQLMQFPRRFPLRMGSGDGLLSTAGRVDREQLCRHNDPCLVSFDVLTARNSALIHVEIQVLDINDNKPQFPTPELELEISESASLRTRIPLDRALDPDAGRNALCSYSLSPSEHFALEVVSGSDGTKHAELVVVKEVDRELHSSFDLILTAVDHGEPPKSGTALIKVIVLDSNDNSPVFAESSLTVEIWEDALPGTRLITVTATDPDQGPNGEIEYCLSKHAPLEVLSTFSIDTRTGSVVLKHPLDYEEIHAYELDVQARDLGANPIPAHCKILIKVLDVNDNAPDVHITWAARVPVLSEALPKDSFVALVTASDPDSGNNGQVHCSLSQGYEHFRLKRTTSHSFVLMTNATLDRELCAEYNLTLLVQDQGNLSLTVFKYLTICISDVNDNAPEFEKGTYDTAIAENSQSPFYLITVSANDPDLDFNGKITYSIQDSFVSGLVSIDPSTGDIFALQAFDHEQMSSLEFLVTAEDGGHPKLVSNVSVRLAVLDENDNAPVITEPALVGGAATISVLVSPQTGCFCTAPGNWSAPGAAPVNMTRVSCSDAPLLFTITARDMDSGRNGALQYVIVGGNEAQLFVLDPLSGQVFLNSSNASSLAGSQRELVIRVSDRGDVPLHTQACMRLVFRNHGAFSKISAQGSQRLSPSVVTVICLAALLGMFLLILVLIVSLCKKEKKDSMAYNCREAEDAYRQQQLKKPHRQIQKTDIHLVPVLRSRSEGPREAELLRPCEEALLSESAMDPEYGGSLQAPFHLTPTLYRTLRNQRNQRDSDEQQDAFNLTLMQRRPCQPHKLKNSAKEPASSLDALPHCKSLVKPQLRPVGDSLPPASQPTGTALKGRSGAEVDGAPGEAQPHQHILRSLVRLSLVALAEQSPTGEFAMESPPVQQISQLLSLLHQGQFQPKTNHRGNKYTTKNGSRAAGLDADCLSTKDSGHGESEAEDRDSENGFDLSMQQLVGEELETLLEPQAELALKRLTAADPEWVARLSLPLTSSYKDNVFSPDSLHSPQDQEAARQEKPRTFETFGKVTESDSSAAGTKLASTFLSEMSTLFEMILSQKVQAHNETGSGLLRQLSARGKSLGLDDSAPVP